MRVVQVNVPKRSIAPLMNGILCEANPVSDFILGLDLGEGVIERQMGPVFFWESAPLQVARVRQEGRFICNELDLAGIGLERIVVAVPVDFAVLFGK